MTSTMEMLPVAAEAPEPRSSKRVLVAGALAAAVALGGAGYFLLLSGGDSSDEGLAAPVRKTTTKPAKPATTAPKKTAAKPAVVPATSTARLGRDPFRALYVQPAEPAPGTAAQAPATSGTDSTGSTAPKPGQDYPLKLVSVAKQPGGEEFYYFTFTVDGAKKTVIQGQRFGKYGELVVLAYGMDSKGKVIGAVIQVGDDSPLEMVVGDKILVQ